MTRGRTVRNFKHPQALSLRRIRGHRMPAVALACVTAAVSLIHPVLALGGVGLMLWQAFSPER